MKPSHESIAYRIFKVFDKVTDTLSKGLVSIPAVILVAWVIVFIAYIIVREFGTPWLFVEEFTEYFMVLATSFAFAYALRTEGHIRIDSITRLLPKRVRNVLEMVTLSLSFIICIYLTQKSIEWLSSGIQNQTRSMFPSDMLLWPVYLLVPIGLSAFGLAILSSLYRSVMKLALGLIGDEKQNAKSPEVK